jgi:hypothetical protein
LESELFSFLFKGERTLCVFSHMMTLINDPAIGEGRHSHCPGSDSEFLFRSFLKTRCPPGHGKRAVVLFSGELRGNRVVTRLYFWPSFSSNVLDAFLFSPRAPQLNVAVTPSFGLDVRCPIYSLSSLFHMHCSSYLDSDARSFPGSTCK